MWNLIKLTVQSPIEIWEILIQWARSHGLCIFSQVKQIFSISRQWYMIKFYCTHVAKSGIFLNLQLSQVDTKGVAIRSMGHLSFRIPGTQVFLSNDLKPISHDSKSVVKIALNWVCVLCVWFAVLTKRWARNNIAYDELQMIF